MKFGNISTANNIFLAPLAGFTDAAFRAICAEHGAGLCYTEMISGKGLIYKNQNTFALAKVFPPQEISACQLFGSEPEILAEAVTNEALKNFDIIDLNMGCPAPKVTKCGEGSALMSNPALASKIIRSVATASKKPVTVKFRRGYKGVDNAVDFAKMCEDSGAAAVTIHARFSEQMYSGTADFDTAKKIKKALKIPVIYSGDIKCGGDIQHAQEHFDAVMIGRAAIGNPWIFATTKQGEPCEIGLAEVKQTAVRQICFSEGEFSEKYILASLRPHILAYLKTAKIKSEQRKQIFLNICKITDVQELKDFLINL